MSTPVTVKRTKSILSSTTFWAIVLLLCQAAGPSVDKVIQRGEITTADIWAMFQASVTALVGVMARYNVGDLYTPKGIPGADPPIEAPPPLPARPGGSRSGGGRVDDKGEVVRATRK